MPSLGPHFLSYYRCSLINKTFFCSISLRVWSCLFFTGGNLALKASLSIFIDQFCTAALTRAQLKASSYTFVGDIVSGGSSHPASPKLCTSLSTLPRVINALSRFMYSILHWRHSCLILTYYFIFGASSHASFPFEKSLG
ncbi:hypothetical protein L1987_76633 [Smallanthus sonchifolius]|uniref:Uncharacterized protein n=1 Tax=Smallanthus sonchifolius TaxID=185202 RepID=A0ACB8Z8T5_9ASTR|nr:hypothetical protein L1987_76633 [Smallanthus sonchifolius]